MTGGPTYRDRLVRQNGRWRIAERGVEPPRSPSVSDLEQPGPPAARWLADRELIRHTTTRWNLALDHRDCDSALACLASPFDVALEPGGPVLTDRASLTQALVSLFERQPAGCHWPGNQLVDLHGDHADVETYVYVSVQSADGRGLTGWTQGARRTVDEMVRQGGRWLIARRRVETNRVS